MGVGSGKTQEISLGSDFDAVVHHGRTTIELSADGNVVLKTTGNAFVCANGDVKVRAVATDDAVPELCASPVPGDGMADGTVYAGISPDTGKAMYTTPQDAPLTYTFNQSQRYALGLSHQKAHDHNDWRVPTKDELDVLFQNGTAIGGFNASGKYPWGWHWSSSQVCLGLLAWAQCFSDGDQDFKYRRLNTSLRCVRG